MRSKNKGRTKTLSRGGKKKNGKKSAYKRSDRIILFLRAGIIVLSILILFMGAAFTVKLSARSFNINKIIVSGNYHLGEADIIRNVDIEKEESLLRLDFNILDEKLRRNPWIRDVSLRRQLPDTLMIRIREAVPKALFHLKGRILLVGEEGNILEEVKEESTPFLPVIKSISPEKDRKGLMEAIELIDALDKRGILSSRESVEIRLQSFGPEMRIDGETIKVGYGRYMEKLERWEELEPEMSKIGQVRYIDLRFRDKVIVKPMKTSEERKKL